MRINQVLRTFGTMEIIIEFAKQSKTKGRTKLGLTLSPYHDRIICVIHRDRFKKGNKRITQKIIGAMVRNEQHCFASYVVSINIAKFVFSLTEGKFGE
jgi:hypothetical protein